MRQWAATKATKSRYHRSARACAISRELNQENLDA
jgi:hypothetical protein